MQALDGGSGVASQARALAAPPTKIGKRIPAVSCEQQEDGGCLVDFGTDLTGWMEQAIGSLADAAWIPKTGPPAAPTNSSTTATASGSGTRVRNWKIFATNQGRRTFQNMNGLKSSMTKGVTDTGSDHGYGGKHTHRFFQKT